MLQSVKLDTPKIAVQKRDKAEDPSDPGFSGVMALMAGTPGSLPPTPKTPDQAEHRDAGTSSASAASGTQKPTATYSSQTESTSQGQPKQEEKAPSLPQERPDSLETVETRAGQPARETARQATNPSTSQPTGTKLPQAPVVTTTEALPPITVNPSVIPSVPAPVQVDITMMAEEVNPPETLLPGPVPATTIPAQTPPGKGIVAVLEPPAPGLEAPRTPTSWEKPETAEDSRQPKVQAADPLQMQVQVADPLQPQVQAADPLQSQVQAVDPLQTEVPAVDTPPQPSPESPRLKTKATTHSKDAAPLEAPPFDIPMASSSPSAARISTAAKSQEEKPLVQIQVVQETPAPATEPPAGSTASIVAANVLPRDKQDPLGFAESIHIAKHPMSTTGEIAPSVQAVKVTVDSLNIASPANRPPTVLAQVEGSIRWMLRSQEKGAELQLHPENLGRVTITLRVEGQEVHARVWASEATTITVLQEHRSFLEESLKQQGLNLGSFDLQSGHRGEDARWNTSASASNVVPDALRELESKQDVPRVARNFLGNTHRIEILV